MQVRTPSFKAWFGDWEAAELLALAERAWSDKNFKGKFVFVPSGPLSRRLAEMAGEVQYCAFSAPLRHGSARFWRLNIHADDGMVSIGMDGG